MTHHAQCPAYNTKGRELADQPCTCGFRDLPTDPAPPGYAEGFGDPVLYLIDRVANLSDALLSPEGSIAMMRKEMRQQHESVMVMLNRITDHLFEIDAKVTGLEDSKDKHENRIHAVEIHHHANGNGAK
jgi:hypothetical protein